MPRTELCINLHPSTTSTNNSSSSVSATNSSWGAGIAQLVMLGLAVHASRVRSSSGEIFFSGRGDFSIGVNMGSNSIPPKTPSDESINRGLVCAHMHFIARTQKILMFMS